MGAYGTQDHTRQRSRRFQRRGSYSVRRLIGAHGEDTGLPDLRAVLTADCQARRSETGLRPPNKQGYRIWTQTGLELAAMRRAITLSAIILTSNSLLDRHGRA